MKGKRYGGEELGNRETEEKDMERGGRRRR